MNRVTGRVIPLDAGSRALLICGHEDRPNQPFWFATGGEAEDDELEVRPGTPVIEGADLPHYVRACLTALDQQQD